MVVNELSDKGTSRLPGSTKREQYHVVPLTSVLKAKT